MVNADFFDDGSDIYGGGAAASSRSGELFATAVTSVSLQ